MYILDIRKQMGLMSLAYLLISLLCAIFGLVYESFSHGVYSNYMIYAFLFPLAGGALPSMAMTISKIRRIPGRAPINLYNAGIASLTIGSLLRGALDIYGTSNSLLGFYWFSGLGLIGASIAYFFLNDL